MRRTKYDKVLSLLEDLRETQNTRIDYDPVNFATNRRDEKIEQLEKELDEVFTKIAVNALKFNK